MAPGRGDLLKLARPLALGLASCVVVSAATGQEQPDPKAIAAAGAGFALRIAQGSAFWSFFHTTSGGGKVVVSTLKLGSKRRTVLAVETGGKRQDVLKIVERDGAWHVWEGSARGKYRPASMSRITTSSSRCKRAIW